MFALYLLLGVGLTVLLHFSLVRLRHLKMHHPESYQRLLRTGGVVGVVLLALRLGVSGLNNLVWLLGAVLPFLRQPHSRGASTPSAPSRGMSREEAARILGVGVDADEAAIREAYRDQIQRNHPDHGGSEYLASQINQAKDVLLKR